MLKRLSNHVQPRISRIYTNFAHQASNLRALGVLSGPNSVRSVALGIVGGAIANKRLDGLLRK